MQLKDLKVKMLKFEENVEFNGEWFAYKLENGTLLHSSEWNGEKYTVKTKTGEVEYIPVYADEPNENDGYDIIGFVEQ